MSSMCLEEDAPATVILVELDGSPTKEFMEVLGAESKLSIADFLTHLDRGVYVRAVRLEPSRGPARAFVCADIDAAKFFTSGLMLAAREYYWIPIRNLPAKTISAIEAFATA